MSLPEGCITGACLVLKDGGINHFHSCDNQGARVKEGEYREVKDSGERREFATGSVRDIRSGKGRFDLIPPYSLRRLAKHYENGAVKYGDRNWEKGQPIGSYLDSMLRHGQDYLAGDRSEDHLAAVAWNAFAAMYTEELIRLGKLPPDFSGPIPLEQLENWSGLPVVQPPGIGSAADLRF